MSTKHFRQSLWAGALALMATLTAVGQGTSQGGYESALEEVVVTAQKREQNPQDVGISIAVLGGAELKALGAESSLDIARFTPGVHISGSNAGQSANFTIRGVTQSDYADHIEAPVAVYIDDVYIPNLQGQIFGMFDVERVEVLKGPQGTLFGRNATGGLVHYVIRKPTAAPEASLDVTYGDYNQKKVEGVLSGPLTARVSGRLSAYVNRFGNVMENVYPEGLAPGIPPTLGPLPENCCQDEWAERTRGARLQLQYAGEALTLRLSAAHQRQNISTPPYSVHPAVPVVDEQGRLVNAIYVGPDETRVAIGPDGNNYLDLPGSPPVRLPGRDWLGFLPPDPDRLVVSKEFARSEFNRTRATEVAMHLDYDFGAVQLAAISAYTKFIKRFHMDGEGGPVNFLGVGQLGDTDSLSQEIRLSGGNEKLRWVGGLYALRLEARGRGGLMAPSGSLFAALLGAVDTGIDLPNIVRLDTDSYSLFGQIEYEFAPRWTFVLGGRVIRESQDYDLRSFAAVNTDDWVLDTATALFETQPSFTDERTDTLWAGKAQLEYRPNDDLLVYLGLNRGVKGGAYNAKLFDGSPPLPASQIPYEPETLLSLEGGFKKTFAGDMAILNASLFYYDYSDYQGFTFQNIAGYVQNRDARMVGGEALLSVRPRPGTRFNLGVSLFDATIKSLQIAPGVFRDVEPAYAPDKQVFASISQRIGSDVLGGELTLLVHGSYISDFYHNIRNFDSNLFDSYALLDVQASWRSKVAPLEVTAFVQNVTDERYNTIGFEGSTVFGGNPVAYGRPRWWGVRAACYFGGN